MDIKTKMNAKFRDLQGGLFLNVSKADVGEGASVFQKAGGDVMAWADMFYPDPSIPKSVRQATIEAVQGGFPSHYTLPVGLYELRCALAEHIHARTGLTIDPSRNVIVTPGSDSGLLFAMMPFLNDGDEVLIPDPSYPSNYLNCKLLGAVAVPVPTYDEENYRIRMDELEKRLTSKTKMVLLTHPNNPTTVVYRRDNLEQLAEFIVRHDLVLVCDQAFEDHIFDGIEFVSPCTLPGMWERTVTVCSLSKGYGLSGYRIGYLYADDHIMDVYYGGAVNVCGAPCTVTTYGAIAALKDPDILPEYSRRLERRRTLAYDILSTTPGVKMRKSESGILSWLNISALGTSQEVADYLMEHAKIMVNQGTPYGAQGEGYIRIVTACFARDEDAALRFERIKAALTELAVKKGLT
ncbi:MAG: pyridoxal phosphate-dependent aminotransferase [Gemmiger sp.]